MRRTPVVLVREPVLTIPHNRRASREVEDVMRGEGPVSAGVSAILDRAAFRHRMMRLLNEGDNISDISNRIPWNLPTTIHSMRENLVEGNDNLVKGEQLERMREALVANSRELLNRLGHKPWLVMDFFDGSDDRGCFTTPMLESAVQQALGGERNYGDLVDGLRANFRGTDTAILGEPLNYLSSFRKKTRGGAGIIGGGTFSDADDVHGRWFQENIMKEIIRTKELFALLECWSYQVMARAMATEYGLNLQVLPGAMKWGVFPVDVLGHGPLRSMFQLASRRQYMVAASTHSDHVVLVDHPKRSLGHKIAWNETDEEGGVAHNSLNVIAVDPFTGLPYGYITSSGRIRAFAFHPEVDVAESTPDDLECVRDFTSRRMGGLLGAYEGVGTSDLITNLTPEHRGTGFLKTNPGPAFYVANMLAMSELMLKRLG